MPFLYNRTEVQNLRNPLELDSKGRLPLGNHHLTSREIEVIRCLLRGCSAKETGLALGISYRTVESYINSLKIKLECHKKSELIGLCIKLGFFRLLMDYD